MSQRRMPGLHWGIKGSFMDYIASMPDSQASASDGATPAAGNLLVWEPAGSPVPEPSDANFLLAFQGDVRLSGHGGLLSVRVADPWISTRGRETVLTIHDPSRADPRRRLPLARLTLETRRVDAVPDMQGVRGNPRPQIGGIRCGFRHDASPDTLACATWKRPGRTERFPRACDRPGAV